MQPGRILCVIALLSAPLAAGQPAAVEVPPELEAWRGWVLHGREHLRCPFLHNAAATAPEHFVCVWPSTLDIQAEAQRGRFQQTWWTAGRDQWVVLPGDADAWPREVTVNGRPATVVTRQGAPAVLVPPGAHQVAGVFAWQRRPATLRVPASTGLVSASVDGVRLTQLRLDGDRLWLGGGEQAEEAADRLTVRAWRLVVDAVPTRLESVLQIDVSGRLREETLRPALPAGFVPLALDSAIPARLEQNGNLRVQVRPGQWQLRLTARAGAVASSLTAAAPLANMPAEEIWSFAADPRLRASRAEAARPVDPRLVGSPWPEAPAFNMRAGDTLTIVETRRGQGETDNSLTLERQLWLDFDGAGFTIVDDIRGTMRTGYRLAMTAPYALLAAADGGDNLLVTSDGDERGVEVFGPRLGVWALGRIEARAETPATGWRSTFDQVRATLNVPPGRKLVTTLGVDDAPTSWTGRWRLLHFFALLIVAVAMARLFDRRAAAVALVALALSFHEPGAPVWTWLNLLAATALVRVAPAGRLAIAAKGYRLASFAMLLLFLVPFALGQIRIAVYPQLESAGQREGHTMGLFELLSGQIRPTPTALSRSGRELAAMVTESVTVDTSTASGASEPTQETALARTYLRKASEPVTDALVQTGPGKPDWYWTPYALAWSGPVDAAHNMRLVIAPRWLVSALRLLLVAALGVFAARLLVDMLGRAWRWPAWPKRAPTAGLAALAAAGFAAALSGPAAHAATPAPELLRELEARLTAPPECAPACADIVRAQIAAAARELVVTLEIHALARVAVAVPGASDGWRPSAVEQGDAPLPAVWRDDALHTLVEAGRQQITLRGPLPAAATVEVPFPAPARVVEARSDHWFIAGIEQDTLASGALTLTRRRAAAAQPSAAIDWAPTRFPVFAQVSRRIMLRREWSVITTVRRLAPPAGAINIEVPLLPGESVVSGDLDVAAGRLAVAMSPEQGALSWTSTLAQAEALTLTAPEQAPWHEQWMFSVDVMWRAEFEGLPPSQQAPGASGRHPVFHPRPGESLRVAVRRPAAAPGGTLAFDRVALTTHVGARSRTSTLTADYRGTRGGSRSLRLPAGAALRSVTVDGEPEPLAVADGELNIPFLPGEHVLEVVWDEGGSVGAVTRTPEVALPAPVSNMRAVAFMPANRWLLFAAGPSLGPAVLYWAELLALVAAALVLGRVTLTPLRTGHWLLLGLGFSTFSWLAFGVVAAWLLAHGAAGQPEARRRHNALKIGLGALTLAAFAAILTGIPKGLLGNPDMTITGFESSGRELVWFVDASAGALPVGTVLSLPLWIYKALILAWALWLSFALLRWLPWIWRRFSAGGLWRSKEGGRTEGEKKKTPSGPKDAWSTQTP